MSKVHIQKSPLEHYTNMCNTNMTQFGWQFGGAGEKGRQITEHELHAWHHAGALYRSHHPPNYPLGHFNYTSFIKGC